ncbi:MAG: endonuclease/exonuclease/phosphatase family protein [Pseudomonadota bacterium]
MTGLATAGVFRPNRALPLLRGCLLISGVASLAWCALWLSTGETFAIVRFALYLAPLLIVGWLVLAGAAALLGRPFPAIFHVLAALLIYSALPPTLTRSAVAAASEPAAISVTTLSNRTRNRDMAATAEAIRRRPADVVILQEVADPAGLTVALRGLFKPDALPSACNRGTYLIVSRHPLGPPDPASSNAWMTCPIDLPSGRALVASVHLPKPWGRGADQIAAASELLQILRKTNMPTIVAGDFNATPLTETLRGFSADFVNAFDKVGAGVGFTFPTPARRLGTFGPFLRIDHIYHSGHFRPVAAEVGGWHPPGADHFPLTVTLSPRSVGN